MNLKAVSQRVTKIPSEVIVLGFFKDIRPLIGQAARIDWIYDGILSRLILGRKIKGTYGEVTLLATQKKCFAQKIMLMGLGPKNQWTYKKCRDVYGLVFDALSRLEVRYCAMELFGRGETTQESMMAIEAMVHGIRKIPGRWRDISVLVQDPERAQRIQQHIHHLTGTA